MITTVCFDVHGNNSRELQENAMTVLTTFFDGLPRDEWTVVVQAHEEMARDGTILLWRGEVEARHHDPAF